MLTRENILHALENALHPLPYVHALWQGGASAFDRVDQWSDLDVQVVAEDGRIAETVAIIEATLAALSPIDLRYELPQPTWHGHWQAFYRLQEASEFLLIDLLVMQHSNGNRFLQPEIHGEAVVHFDKSALLHLPPPLDIAAHVRAMQERIAALRVLFEMFQVLTLKELHRGNSIEALAFYQAWTVRPLVEVLRMQHDPARYNFHTRYIHYNLPPQVLARLEPLFFVASAPELEHKLAQASAWFRQASAQFDSEAARTLLEQASEQHYGV
ncbi:MAG: nucleotidyltransferase domain-containing protein [Chloroflexi bacterium]|nr:nucleotidyltransferase domain-containing protein [Chloroflexota bacterium]